MKFAYTVVWNGMENGVDLFHHSAKPTGFSTVVFAHLLWRPVVNCRTPLFLLFFSLSPPVICRMVCLCFMLQTKVPISWQAFGTTDLYYGDKAGCCCLYWIMAWGCSTQCVYSVLGLLNIQFSARLEVYWTKWFNIWWRHPHLPLKRTVSFHNFNWGFYLQLSRLLLWRFPLPMDWHVLASYLSLSSQAIID